MTKIKDSSFNYFRIPRVFLLIVFLSLAAGCGSSTTSSSSTEDSSASGTVASTVGGAYSSSSSTGTFTYFQSPLLMKTTLLAQFLNSFNPLPFAFASSSCPTMATPAGSGCANTSSSSITLTYGTYGTSSCSFSGSAATWAGSQVIASSSSPSIQCGETTPYPGTSFTGNITRTFGSSTYRTASTGTAVDIDTSGSYGPAADGNTYSGGTIINFTSGVRTQISVLGMNLTGTKSSGSTSFKHTVTTSPTGGSSTPLTMTSGTTITSGTVTVFHNLMKIQGSSSFSNIVFSSSCCTPTSGTISTTFSKISGVTPTTAGLALVGTTETLTFSSCGSATYSGSDETNGSVTLNHCL